MSFDPRIFELRFGCGLSGQIPSPKSEEQVLQDLAGPDLVGLQYPVPDWSDFQEILYIYQLLAVDRMRRDAPDLQKVARARFQEMKRQAILEQQAGLYRNIRRRMITSDGFRERLAGFWMDHFTTITRKILFYGGTAPFTETAIRPFLASRFEEMLISVMQHPMMLQALDQQISIGPNSKLGIARAEQGRQGGINENLARELMELHTLGVDGPYDQEDVQQLSKLLTGLTFEVGEGFLFDPIRSEPGRVTVLGQVYGHADGADMTEIERVLRDLARHPATARHLARKLAVHFVSDQPSESLVDHVAARYRETGGLLLQVYAALLDHPDSWADPLGGNVKQPIDFLGSAFRALAPHMPETDLSPELIRSCINTPLTLMGQKWAAPVGPDGWTEVDREWISSQRYAARLQWALNAPLAMMGVLPDPRQVLEEALGPLASDNLVFAIGAAQTRAEGLALLFASPDFQRM